MANIAIGARVDADFYDLNFNRRRTMFAVDNCPSRRATFYLIGVMVGVSMGALPASQAKATTISSASSGYGLGVDLRALSVVHAQVGGPSLGSAGAAPSAYSTSAQTLSVTGGATVPVVAKVTVGASAVNSAASSTVNGLAGNRITQASGGVVGANISALTLPVLGSGIEILGLDGTLNSTAIISGDFGNLQASGTTTIESLGLRIAGINIDLSAYVNTSIAPNTAVNLSALGLVNASLILNEQILALDNSSIVVNAFHLSLDTAGLIQGNVILGHSQANVVAVAGPVAVPQPTAVAGASVGMATLLGRRRRA